VTGSAAAEANEASAGKACNDGCPANLAVKEAFFAVTKFGAQARSLGRGILTTATCQLPA
jgi:hypothetical protein